MSSITGVSTYRQMPLPAPPAQTAQPKAFSQRAFRANGASASASNPSVDAGGSITTAPTTSTSKNQSTRKIQNQATRSAASPKALPVVVAAGLTLLRNAAVAAAKRYGPAGLAGFRIGIAATSAWGHHVTDQEARATIGGIALALESSGVLARDQSAAFVAGALAGHELRKRLGDLAEPYIKEILDSVATESNALSDEYTEMLEQHSYQQLFLSP